MHKNLAHNHNKVVNKNSLKYKSIFKDILLMLINIRFLSHLSATIFTNIEFLIPKFKICKIFMHYFIL